MYAAGGVLIDPEIGAAGDIDTAVVTLRLANGALAVIDNSRQAVYGYDQRFEVFGSSGQRRGRQHDAEHPSRQHHRRRRRHARRTMVLFPAIGRRLSTN